MSKLEVRCDITIDAPVDVVRAPFGDVAHHELRRTVRSALSDALAEDKHDLESGAYTSSRP